MRFDIKPKPVSREDFKRMMLNRTHRRPTIPMPFLGDHNTQKFHTSIRIIHACQNDKTNTVALRFSCR